MAIDFDALYKRAREKDEKARKSSGGAIVDPNHGKVAIPKPQPLPENTANRSSAGEFTKQALYTGLTSLNKSWAQTADYLLPDQATPQIIQKGIDYYKEVGEKNEEKLAAMSDTGTRQSTGQLLSGAVNMAPSALLAFASGGASAAAQGAALAAEGGAALTTKAALTQAAKEAAKNPMFINSALQTLGPTYEKEKEAGASELQAGSAALANAILGAAVETSGGVETFKKGTGILKNALKTAGEEGLEEAVQYSIENLANKAVGSGTAKWFSTDETEDAVINPAAQAKAAATGAILGGLMGGGQAAAAKGVSKIAGETTTAKPQAIPEAKSAEKNASYTMSPETQQKIFDAVQKRTGVTIQYADLPEGIDGSYENGVITISNKAKNPGYTVLKHELTHFIEKSGEYQALSSFIETSLRETDYDVDAQLDNIIKSYAEIGQNLSPEQAKKEFVAKFSEEYLFNSEKSIERLARDNPNLFRRIYDWIVDTITKIGASQETKFLIDAQRKYEKALRTAGKNTYTGPTLNNKQYLYAGSSALNADLDKRQLAEQMLQEGYSAETVWRDTGWKRDAESGDMKFEIDDSVSKAMHERLKRRGTAKLKDVLKHQELYAAYPELENTKVIAGNYGENVAKASFNRLTNTVKVNLDKVKDREELRSVLLHEVQHRIQKIEGFETGGNSRDMVKELRQQTTNRLMRQDHVYYTELKKKLGSEWQKFIDDEIKKEYSVSTIEEAGKIAYRNLLGEKEARSVQERMNMFPAQRETNFPTYEKEAFRRNEKGKGNAYSLTGDNLLDDSGTDRQSGSMVDSALRNRGIEAGEKPAFSMQKNEDAEKMTELAARAAGYNYKLYHQTGATFTEFNTENQQAGKYDSELPTGIFMKPTEEDIGLRGKNQMGVYAKMKNPLTLRNREHARYYWMQNVPGYSAALVRLQKIDAHYKAEHEKATKEFRDFISEWRKNNPDAERNALYKVEEFNRLYEREDEVVDEWETAANEARLEAKALIDKYISDSNFDGVILEEDQGSFGRKVKSYIVLDPRRVKSSDPVTYDNNMNPIPLSERFNEEKTDIRYSAGFSLQENESLKRTSQNMYADTEGNKLTESQKKFFANSKVRDNKGNLKVMYHGTGNAGFTVFNPSYSGDGQGLFFTDSPEVARGYSATEEIFSPVDFESPEELQEYILNKLDEEVEIKENNGRYELWQDGEFVVRDRNLHSLYWSFNDEIVGYGGDSGNYKVYLNIENPLVVNAHNDNWDEIRVDWEDEPTTTNNIAWYAMENGYDGVIINNVVDIGVYSPTRDMKPSTVAVAFNPNQIKAINNENPTADDDIRFSEGNNLKRDAALFKASQTLYGEKANKYLEYNTQSEAGEEPASFIAPEPVRGEKKATSYQRRARKNAREAVKNILGVSKFADAKKIDAALDAAIEKMKTDSFTTADQDALFDEMFSEGIVVNQQMVKDYANLKQTIRNTQLHVTEDVAKNITDFQTFRKDNLNNVRLSNDSGSEINTFYDELQRDYPQLFPDLNTPAEMLEKISEVGKSIKETETRLQDMYDADFEEFYEESKAAFEREMEKLQDESTRVSRYLKDRNRKISVADAKVRIEEIGRLRREADKVKAKTLLTDIDKTYVEMLHAGKMDETMVRSLTPLSADAIMQVYTAEKPLKEAQTALKETGSQTRAEYRQLANQMLQGSENWKDKKAGFLYGRETAERNMLDIAGSSGRKLIKTFFAPVHKAEAVSTRMKNDLRETVKDLNISIKDAYDVTDLMLDAPGLSEKNAEAKSKGKRLKVSESTLLQLYGEGIISKEDIAHVGADAEKLDAAASVMRNIYNQLIDAANRELVRHGYEPIEYRQNYFPHFSEDKPDGVLANIADKLGFNIIKDELPTDIAGLTHTFKPGKKWFGNALQRTSRVTEYDAVKGFDIYLEGVADVIHQTENIQKLRQLESELRYRYSTEGVKAEIDRINASTELSEVQRQAMLDQVYEKSNTHLGNLAVWLRGYTDNLAGKKAQIDRTFEHNIGRGLYNTSKAIENRVAANMVAINPGSWLTNFIPLVQGSEVKNSNIIKGMAQTIGNHFNHDGIADASTFMTNRKGSDVLWKSKTEVWQDRLTKPMEFIDSFVSESLVRARYLEEIDKGKGAFEAMEIADEFAAGVIADRSKGALPTAFNAKNPISKILTMYQVEVNNQWSHLFKDIPRTEENVMKVAWAYAKFAIGAYIFNDVYEYIIGRRPALDPLSWVNDFVGDLAGKQVPNFVEALFAAMNGEDLELEEKEKKGLAEASANLRENIYEDLPFISGLMGGGRLPIQSAIPDVEAIMDAAATAREGGNREKALSDIGGELLKPATYMVLPMGGGQLKKVGETALALYKGGNYALDSEGEKKLRFAVDPTVWNALKGATFGQYSLKNAQNYVESGLDMLSVKETKAYEELVDSGMKNEEAEAFIRSLPSASKKTELRQALRDSDLTAEQKRAVGVALGDKAVNYSSDATFEYSLMTDEQKAHINKLTGAGATTADALEIYKLQGNYSSGVEKALALMQEDSYTAAICEALGISAATQEKAKALYDEGISMVNYNFAKRYADDNNNGSVSGEEAKAYLDRRTDMSRAEKFALYKALTGAKDKNNPYR